MYRASCIVYFPDQQMHNIYINNILYIVSTSTCFGAPASSPGRLILLLFYSYKNHYGYKLNTINRVYTRDGYTYVLTDLVTYLLMYLLN